MLPMSGFMLVTMFLSMWISNTAAMALMVPIVDSITEAMATDQEESDDDDNDKGERSQKEKIRNVFLLSCAYAANMGGTGVITGLLVFLDVSKSTMMFMTNVTGTPANLVVLSTLEADYGSGHPLSYATWMALTVPLMLLNTLIAWGLFCLIITYVTKSKTKEDGEKEKRIEKVLLARCC